MLSLACSKRLSRPEVDGATTGLRNCSAIAVADPILDVQRGPPQAQMGFIWSVGPTNGRDETRPESKEKDSADRRWRTGLSC